MKQAQHQQGGRSAGKLGRAAALLAAAAALSGFMSSTAAQENDSGPRALRVCQDPNNLPFSNEKGEGIENRIAELFAKSMGVPLKYHSYPQRFAFIRNTLRFKLPGQPYPCDVILGLPAGFDQVALTKPYYRSTYALVFPKGKGLDQVKSGEDFLKLGRDKLSSLRIGVHDKSPASAWLAKHDLVDQGVPYQTIDVNRDHYPGWIIDQELVSGKIDVAIVWGPVASYYAQRVKSAELVVVPLKSEPGVKFDYAMAMGVRHGEPEWKDELQGLIDKHKNEIDAILKDYRVPLVDGGPPVAGK